MPSHVTIIVPTRNEAHNIGPFLASIPAQIPLIVVDASEDQTPTLIAQRRPDDTVVLRRRANVTEARQIGAETAVTDWLLFTDADIAFADDYWKRLRPYLTIPAGAIYGPKQSQDAYQGYYRRFSWGMQALHRLGIPAASGSNLLIRRDVFRAIGGFDLRLTCNEDSEIAWRVRQAGYPVAFAPDLIVVARDHRRLRRGTLRKNLHALTRCALLFSGLMPEPWRSRDWGYWRERPQPRPLKRSQV